MALQRYAMPMRQMGMNTYLAIVISCCFGIIMGIVNGFFIAYFKMTPFIVTLATMQIYKGIVYVITQGMPITGLPENANSLANGIIAGFIPKIVIIMVVSSVFYVLFRFFLQSEVAPRLRIPFLFTLPSNWA